MILTNQIDLTGENTKIIVVGVIVAVLVCCYLFNKFKAIKNQTTENGENGGIGAGVEAAKNLITSIFSEERFQTLTEQCIADSVNALVKGSTKEQFVENIKDNICDALFNFIQTEYPKYTIICSRENIEKLADAVLDMTGFDDEKIGAAYEEQINKLNQKDDE